MRIVGPLLCWLTLSVPLDEPPPPVFAMLDIEWQADGLDLNVVLRFEGVSPGLPTEQVVEAWQLDSDLEDAWLDWLDERDYVPDSFGQATHCLREFTGLTTRESVAYAIGLHPETPK